MFSLTVDKVFPSFWRDKIEMSALLLTVVILVYLICKVMSTTAVRPSKIQIQKERPHFIIDAANFKAWEFFFSFIYFDNSVIFGDSILYIKLSIKFLIRYFNHSCILIFLTFLFYFRFIFFTTVHNLNIIMMGKYTFISMIKAYKYTSGLIFLFVYISICNFGCQKKCEN